jgi:glycosyltransferase involved in cell wall biosynthesis
LRALHIVAGLDPRHGGPSYSVPRLCTALTGQGVDARILTVREAETPDRPFVSVHEQDFAATPILRALRLSSSLARAASAAAGASDVVHAHGLWLIPNVISGRAAAQTGRPLVVSPRGMLQPEALAFSAWRKRLFWTLLQGPAYAGASAWHATSTAEAEEVRAFGVRAPIAVVPNGIDLPQIDVSSGRREGPGRTLLFIGRVHPIKGLLDLIAAWARLGDERPDWTLRIVGPDERGHRAELETMAARLGAHRIKFCGPAYGEDKAAVLRAADLFVLPSRNENFGLAAAEALAAGVPAIVSRGAPWAGLETERCGWWVERAPEPLFTALRTATALPDAERRAMGLRGRGWMARDFGWDSVAAKMLELYRWVAGGAARPHFVSLC